MCNETSLSTASVDDQCECFFIFFTRDIKQILPFFKNVSEGKTVKFRRLLPVNVRFAERGEAAVEASESSETGRVCGRHRQHHQPRATTSGSDRAKLFLFVTEVLLVPGKPSQPM